MQRIQDQNINTKTHWNEVYLREEGFDGVKTYEHIAQHVENEKGLLVDLGCGTGDGIKTIRNTRPLLRFVGVDFSEASIDFAKKNYSHIGDFRCEDVCRTSLLDNEADVVVSSETLEHLENPAALIKESFRILKPEGLFLLTTPWQNRIPSTEHVWSFEYSDIREMLFLAGFREHHVYPYASGRCIVDRYGNTLLPQGNRDTIMVYALK